MELIIISGPAQVGKTTLAGLLAKEAFELGLVPKLISFADPLKREAEGRGYSKTDNPVEYREYCQEIGALKRELDPSYWVKRFEKELKNVIREEREELNKGNPYWERCIIVDDCRYENEVGLGLKYNAVMVFLNPGDRELPEKDAPWRDHHSEELANSVITGDEEKSKWFDYHILNDDDLEALIIKTKIMAPIWTGVQASGLTFDLGEEDTEEPYSPQEIEELLTELIDLLFKEMENGDPPMPDDGSD
jgi:hypothetical protein